MTISAATILHTYNNSEAKRIPAEFRPYYKKFLKLAEQYNADINESPLTISFGKPTIDVDARDKGSIIWAQCTVDLPSFTKPRIIVDKKVWDSLNHLDREELMYHELGHCLLKQVHRDDSVNDYPISIMHRRHMGYQKYAQHREYYLKEMFLYGRVKVPVEMAGLQASQSANPQ